jgi:hypothetical protein
VYRLEAEVVRYSLKLRADPACASLTIMSGVRVEACVAGLDAVTPEDEDVSEGVDEDEVSGDAGLLEGRKEDEESQESDSRMEEESEARACAAEGAKPEDTVAWFGGCKDGKEVIVLFTREAVVLV